MIYVVNNKSKEYEDLKRDFEKKQKEVEELSVLIIMYLDKHSENRRISTHLREIWLT